MLLELETKEMVSGSIVCLCLAFTRPKVTSQHCPPVYFYFFNCMLFGVWPILSKVGLLRAGPAYLLSTVDEFDQKPAKECKLKKK